jgi:CubicO group peptidase (beta-lactamase class C family)
MVNEALNRKVDELIAKQQAEGSTLGIQVCAYLNGEKVVDTWSGPMGPEDDRPVGPDTLFSSFSTTKGPAAACLHLLADRGLIDYEAPVAKYWPAFAAHGKENITVAQAMSHQAGLHAAPKHLDAAFVQDWEGALNWLAAQKPAWEPGTATGYHALTYAWVVGGIVQGASGRHIAEVLRTEIAEPLGIADEMFMGVPDEALDRCATLTPFERNEGMAAQMQLPPDHPMFQAMPPANPLNYNSREIRQACLPSANGHFTARALARMYGALANGGEIDGVRIVSEERIPHMYRFMTGEPDKVIIMPLRKGIGFFLGGDIGGVSGAQGPRKSAFGHAGAGGSVAFADPEVGMSVAVTLNKMLNSLQAEGPATQIANLIRSELGLA